MTRLVAITGAYLSTDDAETARLFDHVIEKPVELDELSAVVRVMLSGGKRIIEVPHEPKE